MLHLLFYVTQHHPFAACEHSEQTFLVVLIYVLACVVYVVNVTQTNTDRHRHRQKERERGIADDEVGRLQPVPVNHSPPVTR